MMRTSAFFRAASALLPASLLVMLLAGCGGFGTPTAGPVPANGVALKGVVHGGQQPVSNAQIELFTAGTSGLASSGTALLKNPVFTDASGSWSITGDYTCPSESSEVYIMALGGNPGLASGTNNSAIVLAAALGQCGNLTANTFVIINEVTTVATAYALAGFVGTTEVIGATSSNSVGLQNAFDTVNNLVNINTGTALLVTPGGHGVAPQEEINSLADILSICVNSSNDESTPCTIVFNNMTDSEGNYPTDVFGAIINLAHNPTGALDPLTPLIAATAPFQPTLSAEPTDWTLGVVFYGGGMGYPNNIAIDGLGNVWVSGSTLYNGFLSKLSPQGVPISPAVNDIGFGGYDLGNVGAGPIAIDSKNNVWMPNTQVVTGYQGGGVVELDNDGIVLSPDFFGPGGTPLTGYAPDSLSGPVSIVADADNDIWIGNSTGVLVEVNNAGTLLSPTGDPTGFSVSGYAIGATPQAAAAGMAIDRASRLWIANAGQDSLVEMGLDGFILTPPPGGVYGGGLDGVTGGSNPPDSVAMDVFGNILTLNPNSGTMSSFSSSDRSVISPDGGYPIGGNPSAIFVDSQDMIYISQPQANAIQVYNGLSVEDGIESIFYNPEVNGPAGIAGDASGNLWVANFGSGFSGSVTELVGIISPTVAPLSVAAGVVAFEP